jgi:hypothetical protein
MQEAAATAPSQLQHNGKLWLTPRTLPELISLLQQHSEGGRAPRITAGNTGSGLFHELWPAGPVVISVSHVKEMHGVELRQVGKKSGCVNEYGISPEPF